MILLGSKQITQGSKIEDINGFKIVFMTPQGVCETLDEANTVMERLSMDSLLIKVMVMAESETIRELCL